MGCLKEFTALLARIPNPVERDVYLSKIAGELQVERQAIAAQLQHELRRAAKKRRQDASDLKVYSEVKTASHTQDIQRARNIRYALAEDKLLAILLKNPDYYEHIAARIEIAQFVTDRNRAIAQVLFTRLANRLPVELPMLSADLSIEQMGVVSELLNSVSGIVFGLEDADAYIDTILSKQTERSQDEVAAMSDDDLKAYIASLASKKK